MLKIQINRLPAVKLTLSRIFQISEAGSSYRLASVIDILLSEKIFRKTITVRFRSGAGVEFASLDEIPEMYRDPASDMLEEVDFNNLEINYSPIVNE